jgi:HK97 family phage major capsid protein
MPELKEELEKTIKPLTDKVKELETELNEYKAKDITRKVTGDTEIKVVKDEGDKPWKSLGEQAVAIKDFYISQGTKIDPRLKITGSGERVPADGGFLIDKPLSDQLIENLFTQSDILSRVTKQSLSGNANGIKFPAVNDQNRSDGYRHGGILGYWAGEGAQKTATKPTFDMVSLELKKLVGLCYCTDEILEDVSFLTGWLDRSFRDEFNFKLCDAVINGDGAAKPLGIMNSPALITVTAETGQGSTTIVAENIIKMWARRISSRASNYVWLINQDIEPQLYTMALAVGTGGVPVYMPAGGISGAMYGTLFARPVIPCDFCQTLGTAGDVILVDLSRYMLVDKGDVQSASSIHLKFDYDETVFRWVYRVDGQPMDKTYITPFKGTNYQSPFIVLNSTRT